MFPRALGVVLIVGGVCYLVGILAMFLVPDFSATVSCFLVTAPHYRGDVDGRIPARERCEGARPRHHRVKSRETELMLGGVACVDLLAPGSICGASLRLAESVECP